MTSLILKPESSFSTMQTERMTTSGLGRTMLLLNRITGAILGCVGVMVLVTNVLLGCVSLLLGMDFTIELLV
jgi:hypothetical protein